MLKGHLSNCFEWNAKLEEGERSAAELKVQMENLNSARERYIQEKEELMTKEAEWKEICNNKEEKWKEMFAKLQDIEVEFGNEKPSPLRDFIKDPKNKDLSWLKAAANLWIETNRKFKPVYKAIPNYELLRGAMKQHQELVAAVAEYVFSEETSSNDLQLEDAQSSDSDGFSIPEMSKC